ncbi:hypothetical protein K378_01557 [Streptomyces sp. Amel2xB2]|nr:hypothetical protein K378_01557 [Streptomyces sp. Amel2xB2]
MGWETAVLDGGPADGLRIRVSGRPRVIQVVHRCETESAPTGLRVEALHIYRRDLRLGGEVLTYGFDPVSP